MHKRAGELAEAWVDLAERDPRVKRTLERLLEATGWGGIVAAHVAIIIPVIANRGMLPDGIANGAAAFTLMQNPEVAPLFNHERWSQNASPEREWQRTNFKVRFSPTVERQRARVR
jgi:hypothetical protein